jgi:integrase
MARTISTVDARSKLPPRDAPYWVNLKRGCKLGYRKLTAGSAGTWLARIYDSATTKQTWRTLGSFEDLQPNQRYDAAKAAAEKLAEHMSQGGTADTVTVKEAGAAYVAHLRAEGRGKTADDLKDRLKRWVDDDKLGRLDVRKLTPHHLRAWRQALINKPVIINPHADEDQQKTRVRAASSVNRDMAALRAALNFALANGTAMSDAAWRIELQPIPKADGRRDVYLDRDQRAALIKAAPADLALFIRGLCSVPLRPGAVAALTVGNFDKRLHTLTIGKDKAGKNRMIRLPPATAAFFTQQCKDKTTAAHIFARADGKQWNKDWWKKLLPVAVAQAELPATTTMYALRHSTITDLVVGGLNLMTVAQVSGTSVAMIEKHYAHLQQDQAAAALATLAV